MNNIRQGDLSLHIAKLNKEVLEIEFYEGKESISLSSLKKVKVEGNRFVLAWGEATGHNHALLDYEENKFEVYQDEKGRHILKINEPITLAHVIGDSVKTADHNPQTVEVGWYVQEQEEEFDPFINTVRKVVD